MTTFRECAASLPRPIARTLAVGHLFRKPSWPSRLSRLYRDIPPLVALTQWGQASTQLSQNLVLRGMGLPVTLFARIPEGLSFTVAKATRHLMTTVPAAMNPCSDSELHGRDRAAAIYNDDGCSSIDERRRRAGVHFHRRTESTA